MWISSDLITIFGDRNLLLHEAGYLKVADFGLGKLLDASSAQTDMYSMTGETGSCKWNLFFKLICGSESAVMVCYTWVWLYCCKCHDQWGFSYSWTKMLGVDIFCRSSFPLFLIDQGLVLVGFHFSKFFNSVTHVSGNWFYVFMLKQIDTWRQRCSCTRLMIRVLMCSPLPSLFRRYWKAEMASFLHDFEQSVTPKVSWPWESQ